MKKEPKWLIFHTIIKEFLKSNLHIFFCSLFLPVQFIIIYTSKMKSNQKENYVLPIAMMFALFFMIAFVTNLQTPFANVVKGQFNLLNWQSLLGNMANFIAYAIMGIPAGVILSKFGYKKTALLAVLVGFTGVGITLVSGYVGSFFVYISGAFISGFSMCLLNTVVNPMLNTLGGSEKKGNQLLLFGGAANSTGGTIAPIFVGILVGQIAKPQISDVSPALFVGMAIFAITFLVLYFVNIPEPHAAVAQKDEKDSHSALSFRHFKFGLIAIFLYVGIEVGIQAIAYLYMTADVDKNGLGMDQAVAGTVVGTYWLLMLVGRLLGGVIAGKVTSKTMLTAVSVGGAILVLAAMFASDSTVAFPAINSSLSVSMVQIPLKVVFLILCGLCTSVMWPNIFNLATSGLGKYTAVASGLFMVMVCGGGILPAIQGAVADSIGYIGSYWVIVAALAYILFFAFAGSKNVNKDIPVN
jgi:FHS family L-fucose permease-like MFS transporter